MSNQLDLDKLDRLSAELNAAVLDLEKIQNQQYLAGDDYWKFSDQKGEAVRRVEFAQNDLAVAALEVMPALIAAARAGSLPKT